MKKVIILIYFMILMLLEVVAEEQIQSFNSTEWISIGIDSSKNKFEYSFSFKQKDEVIVTERDINSGTKESELLKFYLPYENEVWIYGDDEDQPVFIIFNENDAWRIGSPMMIATSFSELEISIATKLS